MKASYNIAVVYAVLVVLLLGHEAQMVSLAAAVTCNPTELSPCMSAISSGAPPSKMCCTKINEQKPCLCQYIKNPSLKQFVNSPNAKKVVSTCGVPSPKC